MIKIKISPDYKLDQELKRFLDDFQDIFDNMGEFLYQKRNVVKKIAIDNSQNRVRYVVVKKYKKLHFFQRIIYTFFVSNKAIRAFNNSIELRKRGIKTPHELACIEQYSFGLFKYGYYISCYTDDQPIANCLEDSMGFDKATADAFAQFVAELHEKGILHYDLNSTNVLYSLSEDKKYSFSVIDINRMKFFSSERLPDRKKCFDNLTRFTGNLDLFQYVVKHYINYRGWSEDLLNEAVSIKIKHDRAWHRRKSFFKWLKKAI